MVFSSPVFLFFFLPVVIGISFIVPFKNIWLLLCSLVFYVWGGGPFIALLLFSIAFNWILGLLVVDGVSENGSANRHRISKHLCIALAVVVNIGVLGWFKYAGFAAEQVETLISAAGFSFAGFSLGEIVLPIGISFFTFQSMSYVFDIAAGRARAFKNPLDFALYVALFPQLIAGPIVRFHEIESQIRHRSVHADSFASGCNRFVLGLAKKVIVADGVAPLADAAFSGDGSLPAMGAWIGVLAYTVQIYFDFSGYSDMAIGMGKMLGFTFPENFRRPYSALSITDFWRRWHITLSHWFRDYLYFPLGGNRKGTLKTYRNLAFVFIVTGLWHGASWTFVVWGCYHGMWLIIERIFGWGITQHRNRAIRGVRSALTLLIVVCGWVIFRAESLTQAGSIFLSLVGQGAEVSGGGADGPVGGFIGDLVASSSTPTSYLMLGLGAVVFFLPGRQVLGVAIDPQLSEHMPWWAPIARLVIAGLVLPWALATVISGTFSPFLYFRF